MHARYSMAAVMMCALLATMAHADVVWDESAMGDLSGSPSAPTAITLGAGTNSIVGSLRTSSSTDNQDWVALTVPSGMALNAIFLAAYNSTDAQGFTGFQTGSSFSGSTVVASNYTGYSHYGTGATNGSLPATNLLGQNLLPLMADNSPTGTAAGAQGFTIPLGAGTYTFLIQQTGTAQTSYQFDYVVVPEPAMMGWILMAMPMLSRRRFNRFKVHCTL